MRRVVIFVAILAGTILFSGRAAAFPLQVSTTYYGGHYDASNKSWYIDNQNQCQRIASGEFTAKSLRAIVADGCDDDNGLTYQNDIPLHNTVSFAELSNNPTKRDYAALGNLPARTKLEIAYKGRCLVAEKRDVGTGGYGIQGKPRALDLWWQTARSLNFTSGLDVMTVRSVSADTPLTPLGSSYDCSIAEAKPIVTTKPTKPKPSSPKDITASVRPEARPDTLGVSIDNEYISRPNIQLLILYVLLSGLFAIAATAFLFSLRSRSLRRHYRLRK